MQLRQNGREYSRNFLGAVAIVTILVALLAWYGQNRGLALASAVLGIYALHLTSIRYILEGQADNRARLETQWKLLQLLVDPNALEPGTGVPYPRGTSPEKPLTDPRLMPSGTTNGIGGAPGSNGATSDATNEYRVPTPRHFALGTVALIRDMLSPAQVARILVEQRQQPEKRFASIAVDLGMLTDEEREELLLAQQEGLFSDAEMKEARERLRDFRKTTARALSEQEQ